MGMGMGMGRGMEGGRGTNGNIDHVDVFEVPLYYRVDVVVEWQAVRYFLWSLRVEFGVRVGGRGSGCFSGGFWRLHRGRGVEAAGINWCVGDCE
jgi:hypothetical protein